MPPTIVLVHGAFADSSSWDGVIDPLEDAGHTVIAAANPLRSVAADAEVVSDLVRSIDGPIVLAAHSYGGAVISNVAADVGEITGLVYVNGFAPDAGESAFTLAAKFPGSTTGDVVRPDSAQRRHDRPCDRAGAVPRPLLRLTCRRRRPPGWRSRNDRPRRRRSTEPSGEHPLWKQVPSWFLIGEKDLIIPAALQRFMAERAGARRTVEIPGASHAISVSQPEATADLILEAAAVPVSAYGPIPIPSHTNRSRPCQSPPPSRPSCSSRPRRSSSRRRPTRRFSTSSPRPRPGRCSTTSRPHRSTSCPSRIDG